MVKVVKVLVKEVHFSPLLVKVRDSLVKVLVKTFVRIRKRVRDATLLSIFQFFTFAARI